MGQEFATQTGITKISDTIDKELDRLDTHVTNVEKIGQDVVRTTATAVDNARADVLSTTRQFESDAAAIIDSAVDNINTTINTVSVAFFDTIQIITILIFGGILLFIMFYGDKIFQNGIRLGKINLL